MPILQIKRWTYIEKVRCSVAEGISWWADRRSRQVWSLFIRQIQKFRNSSWQKQFFCISVVQEIKAWDRLECPYHSSCQCACLVLCVDAQQTGSQDVTWADLHSSCTVASPSPVDTVSSVLTDCERRVNHRAGVGSQKWWFYSICRFLSIGVVPGGAVLFVSGSSLGGHCFKTPSQSGSPPHGLDTNHHSSGYQQVLTSLTRIRMIWRLKFINVVSY